MCYKFSDIFHHLIIFSFFDAQDCTSKTIIHFMNIYYKDFQNKTDRSHNENK